MEGEDDDNDDDDDDDDDFDDDYDVFSSSYRISNTIGTRGGAINYDDDNENDVNDYSYEV